MSLGEQIRKQGAEYGASTGRPSRCGWFDSVVVRYANRINGLDALGITKLDVLDGLPEIKVCTRYRYKGDPWKSSRENCRRSNSASPITRRFPVGSNPPKGRPRVEDLPANARRYLERLEELCGVPVEMVSTGPDRDSTIVDMGGREALCSISGFA